MYTKPITRLKKDDPVMLKQQIMFLKSELVQYENKIKDYQNNYHYSLIEKLKAENRMLQEELQLVKQEFEEKLQAEVALLKKQYGEQEQQESTEVMGEESFEIKQLKEEIEKLKKQIQEKNENGTSLINDLLTEKEEYMEKWETLKSELHKVIQEQAQNQQLVQKDGSEKQDDNNDLDQNWFTNNLKYVDQNE